MTRFGFWLLHKRLEQDRFVWPRRYPQGVELAVQQLHWLLDGIAITGHILHVARACCLRESPSQRVAPSTQALLASNPKFQ